MCRVLLELITNTDKLYTQKLKTLTFCIYDVYKTQIMLKNFKPISLILLAGATCFPASIFAETMPSKQGMNISQQNGKVTGTVVDDLGPVAGASVVVKGTTNGNITDMDGNFTLEGVKNGDIIQISFIGYTTQEIKYTGQSTLQIKLAEDTQKLEEVVVVGLSLIHI